MKTLNHKRTLVFHSTYTDGYLTRDVIRIITPDGKCQVISESIQLFTDVVYSCFALSQFGKPVPFAASTYDTIYGDVEHRFTNSKDTVKAMQEFDKKKNADTIFVGYAD